MEPEEGDCSIAPSGLDMTLALFPPEKDKALKKPDPPPGETKPDTGKEKIRISKINQGTSMLHGLVW